MAITFHTMYKKNHFSTKHMRTKINININFLLAKKQKQENPAYVQQKSEKK